MRGVPARSLVLATILGVALPASGAERGAADGATDALRDDAAVMQIEAAVPDEVAPAVEESDEATPARPPVPAGAVLRATFTTAVDQREPVDSITSLASDRDRVYYFTELVGIDGREVRHRWEYQGEVVAEVPIAVGGPRWRAYSSKRLAPSQLGEWRVSVVDDSGGVVRQDSFAFEAPAPTPEAEAPTQEAGETASGSDPDPEPAATSAPASPASAGP